LNRFQVSGVRFQGSPLTDAWNLAPDTWEIMRDNIVLQCGDCKNRNYVTTKNKKKTTQRLEFKKFCRFCRKHTAHKETK